MSGPIEDLDDTAHEMVASLVSEVRDMRKQITRPALSQKLTRQEMWELWGKEYITMREDMGAMKMTLDAMGQEEAVKFSREMEMAMQEQEQDDGKTR